MRNIPNASMQRNLATSEADRYQGKLMLLECLAGAAGQDLMAVMHLA